MEISRIECTEILENKSVTTPEYAEVQSTRNIYCTI